MNKQGDPLELMQSPFLGGPKRFQIFHMLLSLLRVRQVIRGNVPLNKVSHHIKLQSKSFLSPLFRRQDGCKENYRERNENYLKH